MSRLDFKLEAAATGSRARAGRFTTRHNEVLTPTFMPVGTHAAVRSQRREDLLDSGAQVLLANTYHLLLRPGVEIFEKFGEAIPAILITADRSPHVRAAAREENIAVLNKPVKPASLRALVGQWRIQQMVAAE